MDVIEVQNLVKYFGKTKAVDGISFQVEKGEIFGFLGPNGAGKTTTIRCMMDFIRPMDGRIIILGKDAQKNSVELKSKIGYLSDTIHLYGEWTGEMHIEFMAQSKRQKDITEALIKRLDFNPTKKTKKLSSGNRQKLGLIMALMHEPEVLIFDEPTASLDPLLQNTVYELFEEARTKGTTIFMSSHNLNEVERICTRIGIIKEGKIVAIESVEKLKQKKIYSVQIFSQKPLEKERLVGDGVEITKELSRGVILTVRGDINPLIEKLNGLSIEDIEIKHASLEEIFLEYYK